MVDCSDFLEGYSDFRDGLLEPWRVVAWRDHLDRCASCARYDRVVESGARLVRELPEIQPSDDFLPRLQHRIFHLDDARGLERDSSAAPLAVIALIAGIIGGTAWFPLMRPQAPVVELPAVVAHAPYSVEAAQQLLRPGPFLAPPPPRLQQAVPAVHTLFFPYSPIGSQVANPGRPRLGN